MNRNYLFEECLRQWMISRKPYVKESTYANYSLAAINHIVPALGKYGVGEIMESTIQNQVLEWAKGGRVDKSGGLSIKTIKDLMMIIKSAIRYGNKKLDMRIPDINIYYPKNINNSISKVQALNDRDYIQYLEAVERQLSTRTIGIAIALNTGIRIGELCALKWEDIDLENNQINITKTLQRIFGKDGLGNGYSKVVCTNAKTAHSIRSIPISSKLKELLEKTYCKNPSLYVLTNTEKYVEPRNYRIYFYRFLKNNKLRKINFHGLRHTFATRLIEKGVDYKTVSELLGHANVTTTMNLYVHPSMDSKRKAVECIND